MTERTSQPRTAKKPSKTGQARPDVSLPDDTAAHLHAVAAKVRELAKSGRKKAARGTCVLFTGPTGTGKTLAAEILANELGLALYRVDLSAVVSKYIGETEKNLSRVFSAAERAQAVLFFDEADSLFGKRTDVQDAHDRYANVDMELLLRSIENYRGVVAVASNMRDSLDPAFLRRVQCEVSLTRRTPKRSS